MLKPYLPGRPPTYAACFDPATMTAVAAGAVVASSAVGAVGAIQSGQAAKKQGEFQSAIMTQQADREREDAAARERDFRTQQSRVLASRRAAMGGSGIDPSEGSPLLVDQDFTGESELQALRIRSGGEVAATRLQQGGALHRFAGANAETSSFFRAGSLLLGGAGNAYGYYSKLPSETAPYRANRSASDPFGGQ